MTARGNHAKIKSVEVVDDHTVRFKTDGPYPLFVERMTALVMHSEKVLREKPHEWVQENPIGTGPYKFVRWSRKQEHLLVRNDDYWGAKPAFKYVRIRIIPEQATQIAELISGGVDIIKAVPPDQMDVIDKSGQARTATSPILRTAFLQLDQAARSGPNPFTDRRVRQAANLAVDAEAIIKHVLNGLGDRTATGVNPMAFGWDPGLKPYRQDIARAKKLLAEAGYPNGVDITFHTGPPVVEPAIQQTNDAIVADLAKAGFRVKQNYIGDNTVLVARVKDGKSGPMFNWSWGYYSVFDADAILYDVFKCNEPYSYYCNKELDDMIHAGRSSLDQKKRADIYVKAQKLLFDDAAYLYKWGLRGVWGIANRVEYQAPADEIDRMFLVTPRKK
jgi:peptide/nickel transport system substrate-binding protein